MRKTKGEILAPAGNGNMLEAAVRCGADAVYFGAKAFSARGRAENFSEEEIGEIVSYCRIRGVKTYLAMNTLLKTSELEEALALAKQAYLKGVDALIVQDTGLATLLKEHIPGLPLHASTQMSVHSPSALPLLKEAGFVRVVAAREMTSAELAEFCKAAAALEMEVEVFVHGALCMSVSGQCLLSGFLGSRSGNRGLCAGACRLPFKNASGREYALSLKDLSLLSHLTELTEMGVASFKIEGRMKRPEYAAAATAAAYSARENGFVSEELFALLKNVFSRSGFTDGYYTGKRGTDMFGIRTQEDAAISDKAFAEIHGLYRAERQCVDISLDVSAKKDEPLSLTVTDGTETVIVHGEIPQAAERCATDGERLETAVNKFGATPYFPRKISVECDDGLFIPAAEINSLRREAAERLSELRGRCDRADFPLDYSVKEERRKEVKKQKLYARFYSAEQIPTSLPLIDGVIFPLEKEPPALPGQIEKIAEIPRFAPNEAYIKKRLLLFKEHGFTHATCGNVAAVALARDAGFKIVADTGLNICNYEATRAAVRQGAEKIILSSEMLLSDINRISATVPIGIIAYGRVPLMLYRACPVSGAHGCAECEGGGILTDRLGTEFTVQCRHTCSELLNSVPIWLADRAEELLSVDFTVLYFTDESSRRVVEVMNAYREKLPPDVKFTRGLFYRGII